MREWKRFGLLLAFDAITHARCRVHRSRERWQWLFVLINCTINIRIFVCKRTNALTNEYPNIRYIRFSTTIHAGSSNGRSDCTNGFNNVNDLLVALGLENRDRQRHIIPDINFTCDHAITKWIVAGRWNDGGMRDWYPDLQIWRSTGTNMFTKVGNTTLRVEGGSDTVTYYEYSLTTPLNWRS